jgi:6-phosphogluconolactonase
MKTIRHFAVTFLAFCGLSASAGPAVLYVSESGDKRIAVYAIDEGTGELTRTGEVEVPGAPGSLAIGADRRHVYAAVRTNKQIATFEVDRASGLLKAPVLAPAGSDFAYIFVDRTGGWLLGASYGEGVVSTSRIVDGLVTGDPVSTVETGRKAHCIMTDPANRFAFVPHAGELNKVEQLKFDATTGALTANTPPHLPGGEGHGPRHMQFHPNGRWVYLVNEQGQSVSLCDYDAATGTLKLRQTVSSTPDDWDKSKGSCADIHISADGRFAYSSNRGHDSIGVFSINPESGELAPLGQTPRSFCLVAGDKFLVSAGQGSNRLIVYRRDEKTGALTPLKTYDCGKSPAWVLPVKFE